MSVAGVEEENTAIWGYKLQNNCKSSLGTYIENANIVDQHSSYNR